MSEMCKDPNLFANEIKKAVEEARESGKRYSGLFVRPHMVEKPIVEMSLEGYDVSNPRLGSYVWVNLCAKNPTFLEEGSYRARDLFGRGKRENSAEVRKMAEAVLTIPDKDLPYFWIWIACREMYGPDSEIYKIVEQACASAKQDISDTVRYILPDIAWFMYTSMENDFSGAKYYFDKNGKSPYGGVQRFVATMLASKIASLSSNLASYCRSTTLIKRVTL